MLSHAQEVANRAHQYGTLSKRRLLAAVPATTSVQGNAHETSGLRTSCLNVQEHIHRICKSVRAMGRASRWQSAIEVLRLSRRAPTGVGKADADDQTVVNAFFLTAVVGACGRAGQWTQALMVLQDMHLHSIEPHIDIYSATLAACKGHGQWATMFALLCDMQHRYNLRPSASCYGTVLTACVQVSMWPTALALLSEMRRDRHKPLTESFNVVLSTVGRERHWALAAHLLADEIRFTDVGAKRGAKEGVAVTLDVPAYNIAISACQGSEQWQHALVLLRGMDAQALQPDVVTYGALINARRQWRLSLVLLSEASCRRITPNVIVYGSAMAACKEGDAWQWAVSVLSHSRQARVELDRLAYNMLLGACEGGGSWETVVALFADMRLRNFTADVIACNATIRAWCGVQHWTHALSVLRAMKSFATAPDSSSYTVLISTCARSEEWKLALQLFEESTRHPTDAVSAGYQYNAAIYACSKGNNWRAALALLLGMRSRRIHYTVGRSGKLGDASYFPAIMAATEAGQPRLALQLYKDLSSDT